MAAFVDSTEFKALNVGFHLNECMASEDEAFNVYCGERCSWKLKVPANIYGLKNQGPQPQNTHHATTADLGGPGTYFRPSRI